MANKDISTSKLLQRLFKTANIVNFFKRYDEQMSPVPLHIYLVKLCKEKNVVAEHIINDANIERSYGHQIFSGRKKPSRDKVIQLAFGFKMNYDEAQELLKIARKSPLYPRAKRDAAIIYVFKQGRGLNDIQIMLNELGLPILGKEERNE